MSQLLGTRINTGGTITSLFDLGLEFKRDGTITLNAETLTAALANHPDDVKALFAGKSGVTGLGTLLTDKLNTITQPFSGTSVLPIHAAFRRRKSLLWKPFGFFR